MLSCSFCLTKASEIYSFEVAIRTRGLLGLNTVFGIDFAPLRVVGLSDMVKVSIDIARVG